MCKPYRADGCPYLLLKREEWMSSLDTGSYIEVENITYVIMHIFHDCIAIRRFYT